MSFSGHFPGNFIMTNFQGARSHYASLFISSLELLGNLFQKFADLQMLCGHAFSHFPHSTQSDAFP